METLTVDTLDEGLPLDSESSLVEDRPQGKLANGKPLPPSKEPFDTKGFHEYQRKSLNSKRDYLKNEWLDLAYLSLARGKQFAKSVTKKDFGKLVQVLMAAGIAYDKVFPKVETPSATNLVLNLFNGLPTDKVVRVIGQEPLPIDKPVVSPPDEEHSR